VTDRDLLSTLVLARGTLDRAAQFRSDQAWQRARCADPGSRVMWVCEGASPMLVTETSAELMLTPANQADAELTFLGLDDDDVAYFAAHVDDQQDARVDPNAFWKNLRAVGVLLSDRDAGLMVTAVAIDNWMRTHPRCPKCGDATHMSNAGWSRKCVSDGSEHFPRTDPAVIVLVTDADDRALLGRQAVWQEGFFSTLAGFVESGESAEAALRREVFEESGVTISTDPADIVYLGSQPWPFPCSLMLGYHAKAVDPTINVDGSEIVEAMWISRGELLAACEKGEVRLPPSISIARKLIERWYGGVLPESFSRA
jgi:NAD+ diphosphatase